MIKIVLFLLIILIILDFVPIKFAIKFDDAKKNLREGNYICNTESKYAMDTGWIAHASLNQHLDDDLCVIVSGNSPNTTLSEKTFDFKCFEVSNSFFLDGKVNKTWEDKKTNNMYADLYVNRWQIIYPIERTTFRQYYTPKAYLTIYDYDWSKAIKLLFTKK